MLLSEKAKGKQRAVDPLPDQPEEVQSFATRTITIRFTENAPDLDISVNEKDAVRDLKKYIRRERPKLKNRRLRLIHSGRLLTDGTFIYSWLKSLDERQQRAISLEDGRPSTQSVVPTWLHCSVGREIDDAEEENDEGKVQTSQIQPARGFDRLASIGFTEEEIASVRRQFHSQSSGLFPDDREFDNDEDYDEHARALEEQWIDNLDSTDTSLSQSSSSGSPAIMGIMTGFFFPFIPLFVVSNNRPPPPVFWEDGMEHRAPENVVFSKTMQMGLVAGFLANILFGMWRFLLDMS